MKWLLHISLNIWCVFSYGQIISVCSWNLKDLGKSKNDIEIEFIANTIKVFDVVALQEVVAGYGGAQAVARLAETLNRKGSAWDYLVSAPTSSSAYKTERYAFLWKKAKIRRIGSYGLEQRYNQEIDREPFFVNFSTGGKIFTVVNFHAITKSKQPETEIKYFKFLPAIYNKYPIIFGGDFNLPQSHSVFAPLRKLGYESVFKGQKTSLRQRCLNDGCLASEFDNFFYKKDKFRLLKRGVVHFYKSFSDLKEARLISDHVPIYYQFSLN